MLRSTFLRFAAASLAGNVLRASTRPRYGGVLRVQLRGGLRDLAPSPATPEANRFRFAGQVYEALLRFEEDDRLAAWLATSWRLANGPRRQWAFPLRESVFFHDGTALTGEIAAAAIDGNSVAASAGAQGEVLAASTTPSPLLRVLAESGKGIVLRSGEATFGTGPFRVASFTAERALRLEAFEKHWAGRPFLDRVDVGLRSQADPFVEVELNRAEIAEIPASDAARAAQRGLRLWRSKPVELLLLEVENGTAALGEALSRSLDRDAIQRVILQGEGVASASLLPDWLSGYGFLFPAGRDVGRARALVGGSASEAAIVLRTPADDVLLRSVAGRIAVDTRALGMRLEIATSGSAANGRASLRLRRVRIRSIQPGYAIRLLAADLGRPTPQGIRSAQSVYDAESQLLGDWQRIPIAHIPDVYAVKETVKSAVTDPVDALGRMRLDQLWLAPERG